ncbi:Arv1-like family-domain-containing protein [Podospora conica]|nr:Arv1-like family-domain-containing protein [Schizothecium conicum]
MSPSSTNGLASSSSSSTLAPAARDPEARPRNRRLATATSTSAFSSPSRSPTRDLHSEPIPASRIGSVTGRNNSGHYVARSTSTRSKNTAVGNGALFESSWTPSWASVTQFANSLLAGGGEPGIGSGSGSSRQGSRNTSRSGRKDGTHGSVGNWGPEPPSGRKPRAQDIGAGSLAQREAALKAMRTASVLESHDGVNGGLDVTGNFKKRGSDEDLLGSAQQQEAGDHLVYIHHVTPNDTYAGIVLKYRCREDAFRKANGLWSRDNIQIRKWLALPVDACEIRGRPCEGPSSSSSGKVDLLAKTPEVEDPWGEQTPAPYDFFGNAASNGHSDQPKPPPDDDQPWTHVRWVSIDSCPHPVEIARVPRKALGFFPPRRKKSIQTISTLSTPRGSVDIPSIRGSDTGLGSPGSSSSRRPSVLSARPTINSSTGTSRTRVSSIGATGGDEIFKPAWMRRPGGVGSMGRGARTPGPERDYFSTWAQKHIPGMDLGSMPSMSIMGSEVARIGFGNAGESRAAIVESPFEDGRTAMSAAAGAGQGNGLDKAAAAVETWLRGAFAKMPGPGTPVLGPRGRTGPGDGVGDLIELTDTNSDDGRGGGSALVLGDRRPVAPFLFHTSAPPATKPTAIRLPPSILPRGQHSMPICIECRHPVKTLWREGGGDKASGHNIRLTVCKNCGRFCDKYVEHDFVVIFIDLVLIKPQVYRHLLHNTLMKDEDKFAPSIIRLGILLLLFDVYLTWARIERQSGPADDGDARASFGRLAQQPIVYQYLFFLVLCTLSTAAFHGSIRFLTSSAYSPLALLGVLPRYSRPNSVSTALLVSSSTKLFPILLVIWDYDVPAAARSLGWAVVANNVEALKILLGCGYGVAALLATAGALSRWAMGRAVLWAAGLEGVDSAGESSVAEDGRALGAMLMHAKDWAGRLAVG